jgi:hypothetical protein
VSVEPDTVAVVFAWPAQPEMMPAMSSAAVEATSQRLRRE